MTISPMPFVRLAGLLLLFCPLFCADDDYNIDAQALPGYTGYILAPSIDTTEFKKAGLSLHRFLLGLTYGWPRNAEFGVSFDLKEITPITPFTRDTFRARAPALSFHGKLRLLESGPTRIGLAVGQWRHTSYVLAAAPTWHGWRIEGGPSFRRRSDETTSTAHFLATSFTRGIHRTMVDYDGQTNSANLGWRTLISDNIRIDLFWTRLGQQNDFFDRFYFGVNITS